MRHLATIAAVALTGAVVTGCAVGPEYTRPPVTTPAQIRGNEAATAAASSKARVRIRPGTGTRADPSTGFRLSAAITRTKAST